MRSVEDGDLVAQYAVVLEALPIAAYIARSDGSVAYVSRAWSELTGHARAAVLGIGYHTLIHPDHLEGSIAAWERATRAEVRFSDEFPIRFADGSYHWVLVQTDPLRHEGGSIFGWFGTLTELEGHRRLETELREQSAFNARLLASSDDCIKILDLEGRLLSMNEPGQRFFGITDFETVRGTSWVRSWSEDQQHLAQGAVDAARGGEIGHFTGHFPIDGTSHWFDVVVTAVEDDRGDPRQLLAVSRNITFTHQTQEALRESEARYRAFSEALPGMTWSASPQGQLDFIGHAYEEVRGRTPEAALGDAWLQTLHPEDRERTRALWQHSIDTGQQYDAQFRLDVGGGVYRWQLARALPVRNENGAIERWIGVNIDIDDQRRADDAREMFVALVDNSDDFIGIADPGGKVIYVNAAGRALLELGSLENALATNLRDYFMPEDRAFVRDAIVPAIEREGHWIGDFRLRNFSTGKAVPVTYNVFRIVGADGKVLGIATVSRDRRARERVESGLRLLARTGAAALDSLDLSDTLRNIARAFLDGFASYCIIDVLDSDGIWHRTGVHSDVSREPLLLALSEPSANHPIARALRSGDSSVVSVDASWAQETPGAEDRADVVRTLGVRSFITVPVIQPGGTIVGALTAALDSTTARADYTDDDLGFVQEAGRRAGAAMEKARLYERERRIAVELQSASLPASLPQSAGLFLDADYRPGSDEATIGGDWYDAFRLDDGRIAITVGDVLGHGLGAAVTMTKLRQSMQSAAMVDPDPNVMLAVADKTLRLLNSDAYATAIAAIYDPAGATLTFASAGHPGPALRTSDGKVEDFASHGLMLGLRTGDETNIATFAAPHDATLVFFTDGLVEATRDIEAGYERLRAALAQPAVVSGLQPARALVDFVLDGRGANDDIAVLVARIGSAPK